MSTNWQSLCPGCFQDKGMQALCPHCGYDETAARGPLLLPHRTLLHHQFLVGRVLGKPGGFGITYLAFDTGLETLVAIKEYLPRDLAGRSPGHATVCSHSYEEGELFRFGLNEFLNEARTLAKFDHAHLVRVRHVFEENGTAYLVMDYYQGVTLAEYVQQKGRLPEQTALAILMPILDGLREVHAKGFIHRDIKPQNIYLTQEGRAILLDFGAARLAMAERSRSISVVLSAGYAPFEQYSRRGEQGPWTDVYACAAVLYFMLTSEAPPEAMDRVDEDCLPAPQTVAPGLSAQLASVLVKALAVKFKQRYQSIKAFQDALLGLKEQTEPKADVPAGVNYKAMSFDALQQAAKKKDAEAEYQLGLRYEKGQGVAKNYPMARHWYRAAVVQGHAAAKDKFEKMDVEAEARAKAKAMSLEALQQAANQGDAEAQFQLGLRYEKGQGIAKNYPIARQWYQSAAWQEHTAAKDKLERMDAKANSDKNSSFVTNPIKSISVLIGSFFAVIFLLLLLSSNDKDPLPLTELATMFFLSLIFIGYGLSKTKVEIEIAEKNKPKKESFGWAGALLVGLAFTGLRHAFFPSDHKPAPKPQPAITQQQAPSTPQPINTVPIVTAKPFEPEMVYIPQGSFTMGCVVGRDDVEGGCSDDEKPSQVINVDAFYMGKTEITFDQWDACEAAKQCPHADDSGWGRGTRPVINVSWNDAQVYIQWLNSQTGKSYYLPSEAQWEYAARGGHNDWAFPWGNTASHDYANYGTDVCCNGLSLGEDKWLYTAPVAGFPANDYGLYDMSGNVYEWTCSAYAQTYSGEELKCGGNSATGTRRVLRGGAWDFDPGWLRSAYRYWSTPGSRYGHLGFRLSRM